MGSYQEVSVVASSAANDKLSQFYIGLTGLTLTSQSGKAVDAVQRQREWGEYLQPRVHPSQQLGYVLWATSVADDTYTSATLTAGSASFTCLTYDTSQNSLFNSVYAYGQTPQSQVTVKPCPRPITITGDRMALMLRLQGGRSRRPAWGSADRRWPTTIPITPDFQPEPAGTCAAAHELHQRQADGGLRGGGFSDRGQRLCGADRIHAGATRLPRRRFRLRRIRAPFTMESAGLSSITAGMFVDMDFWRAAGRLAAGDAGRGA